MPSEAEERKFCRLAKISVICASVHMSTFIIMGVFLRAETWVFPFLFITTLLLAITTGIAALLHICFSKKRLKGSSYAIISILVCLIFPVLNLLHGATYDKTFRIMCEGQVVQIGKNTDPGEFGYPGDEHEAKDRGHFTGFQNA